VDNGYLYEPEGERGFLGKFASFCVAVALLLLLITLFYLSSVAMTETVDMNLNNPAQENVDTHVDNYLKNVLLLALSVGVAFLWMRVTERIPAPLITAVCLLGVTAFGVIFILSSQSAPTHDSQIVSNAAYLASKGDASGLASVYFKRFPFQLGYVLYSEGLIRLLGTEDNYLSIEIANVLCLAVTYFALLRSVRALWGNGKVYKMTALLFAVCLPPVLFCSFTYGTIPGLMLASLALWQILAMRGTGWDWLHGMAAALFIGAGVAVKKNFTIVFIAILILLCLRLLRKFSFSGLVCIFLSVLSVWGIPAGVQKHYENRFELDFGKGIPMSSWAAMGINEAYIAPGWYDVNYTVINFRDSGMDHDVANERSLQAIRERVAELRRDPHYTNAFFAEKTKSQWNEPSCQSIWTNQVRGRYKDMGSLAEWICGEGEYRVKAWMNLFQQMTYVMATYGVLCLLKKRRIEDVLIPTVILGGFLYHLICEAKSQYIIPYLILMIPLAAYGLSCLMDRIPQKKKGAQEVDAFGVKFKVLMEYTLPKSFTLRGGNRSDRK